MAFEGMDPERVRTVALGINAQAEALHRIVGDVESLVAQVAWIWPGPDADDFTFAWSGNHRGQVVAVASGVGEAAALLFRQIEQQLGASDEGPRGDGAGIIQGAGSNGGSWSVVDGAVEFVGGATAWASEGAALVETFATQPGVLNVVGSASVPLAGIGLGFAVGEYKQGIDNRDAGQIIMGTFDAAGTFAPPPIAVGVGAFSLFVDATIPVGPTEQDSLLDFQAERMFGVTDRADLTPEQALAISQRYDGGFGVANMISDKMDQTADEIGTAFSSAARFLSGRS